MLINKLNPGEKLLIHVEKGAQTMEFTTEVVHLTSSVEILNFQQLSKKLHSHILPVKLITDPKTNTAVTFPETNIVYKVYVVRDKVPYVWRRINIRRMEKSPYHILISQEEAHRTDRRAYPRIPVGLQGTARLLNGPETVPVTIKNLSGGGAALITEASTDTSIAKVGMVIQHVTFTDPELNMTFDFSAYVVRITKYTNGRTQFACKLNSKSLEISAYVNQKLLLKQEADLSVDG